MNKRCLRIGTKTYSISHSHDEVWPPRKITVQIEEFPAESDTSYRASIHPPYLFLPEAEGLVLSTGQQGGPGLFP